MFDGSSLAIGDGFRVAQVRCTGGCPGFDAPEETTSHGLVFVRLGAFVRRVEGHEALLDSTVAYLTAPGAVEQFAHPVAGGDTCIVIRLSPALAGLLTDGDVTAAAVPMDAASEFAVRRIASLAQASDADGALAELIARTMAALIRRGRPEPGMVPASRPRSWSSRIAAHGRLAQQVREILLAEPGLGVIEVSRRAGYSPHHLSRVFGQVTGSSISRYRNRIRVSRALDRIAQGETSLAALACDLGFADHAHLTRTVRAVTGYTPTACRDLLDSDQLRNGLVTRTPP
jgi:AraC-like DNA-binding protein